MKNFKDKVAVITGAASGIGKALAKQCCQAGMQVVLADIEEAALRQTEQTLASTGANILAVPTDVSQLGDIESLAQKTVETFGAVHLLFNNAGVAGGSTLWESTQADWEWVMGVNFWSVIHGLRTFVPIMLEQKDSCHIVNTASMAGLLSPYPAAVYSISKHAVVALTEQLYHEMAQQQANINVSLLCPGRINTRILESARNRPAQLQNDDDPAQELSNQTSEAWFEAMRPSISTGLDPDQVAVQVFEAIRQKTFYIIIYTTDNRPFIRNRFENLLAGRNPTPPDLS